MKYKILFVRPDFFPLLVQVDNIFKMPGWKTEKTNKKWSQPLITSDHDIEHFIFFLLKRDNSRKKALVWFNISLDQQYGIWTEKSKRWVSQTFWDHGMQKLLIFKSYTQNFVYGLTTDIRIDNHHGADASTFIMSKCSRLTNYSI